MSALRNTYFWVTVGVVAVAAVIGVALLASGGDGKGATVTGNSLPRLDAAAPEAALGMAAPQVRGVDFDGKPVAIEANGTPKAIVFLTHW